MKRYITGVMAWMVAFLFSSCISDIKDGTTDIDSWPNTVGEEYMLTKVTHPGILHTTKSIERMREIVKTANANSNAYKTYLNMKNDSRAKATYAMQGPFEYVSRDDSQWKYTKGAFENDCSAAYLNALMWCVTQDEAHAQKANEILVAYANKLKGIPASNDRPLQVGLQGFHLICATEMLSSTWDKMGADDLNKIKEMFKNIFLPVMKEFYEAKPYTNGNWGVIITKAYLAYAILTDDVDLFNDGINFFFYGNDNGTLPNYISETGQCQESGRDQGHVQLGIGGVAAICEVAHSQGIDLYGALDNRLMKGYEYAARYNLGYDDLPFTKWQDVTGKYSNWGSMGSQARGQFRAIYAMGYNHYVNRKGLSMPNTKEVVTTKLPIEGYDADNVGYGTFQFCEKDF